ncbi:hypothetical protein DPSP01_012288 [Paraphaeosphaeria sporulosa]|uniref:Glutathione-dependent formaldehyde-activating n=1 Tax=Paraphaeosphaeria sporulosa TaxID=1460663 RepID=A0A177CUF2_9PLEO|nr:glutathione-dependent formaldehyde-activating [Paraphaeosphaeria sporulosa]OAG10638.1 glutathione-dependent formaldehyde-activating [Paraphaeosphaeria sporulosa]
MSLSAFIPLTGRCSCAALSYTLTASPLITHICYCTWCQRESGSICAVNSIIESSNFSYRLDPTVSQPVALIPGPTPSGNGQTVARCPVCFDGLWKYYGDARFVTYVKAGTLDEECFKRVAGGERVHIYTSTKPEWVDLGREKENGVGVFEEYYVRETVWVQEALERREKMLKAVEGVGS